MSLSRRFGYKQSMSLFLPAPETLYAALLARDPSYDGHALVAVATTGIFCRLSCPARKPNFANTQFFDNAAACLQAGFRPCLRCRPLDTLGQRDPLVADLLARLEAEPRRNWSEADLVSLHLDPSTVRRAFHRHLGISFLALARLHRAGRGMAHLAAGKPVIDAQLEAGYDSSSGFREAIHRLLRDNPEHLRGKPLLKAQWIDTLIGVMLAIADETHLHLLEFFDRQALPRELERLRTTAGAAFTFAHSPVLDTLMPELQRYFAGIAADFRTPLALAGSPFSRRVWQQLQRIPAGTVQSYLTLAQNLGQPTATRAVARANGANQLAVVIPCHRVIGHDGSLTGYGGGLWRKQWLINHEKLHFSPKTEPARLSQR